MEIIGTLYSGPMLNSSNEQMDCLEIERALMAQRLSNRMNNMNDLGEKQVAVYVSQRTRCGNGLVVDW